MIRKLAEELANNEAGTVQGENNALPLDEPRAPALKSDATPDPEHGFTQHSGEGHARTSHGFLQRSLDQYRPATRDYERVMTQVLGEHVKQVSGSSATSQKAAQRFRERKR
jgi:hypothetical protein